MSSMRRFRFAFLSFVLIALAQPLLATTYYVGTCKVGAYKTINAAVEAVPGGSIIYVCPGIYPEQVTISKALTLQGMLAGNSSRAIIAVPSSGLAIASSISLGQSVAAQIEVTAPDVNITGITVDGTASSANCSSSLFYIGIFYATGSAGTVNEVETRNLKCYGIGIIAENGAGAAQSVTIENSNFNNYSITGIWACSNQTPSTLTVSIKGNTINGGVKGVILNCGNGLEEIADVAGSVSDNTISGTSVAGVHAGSSSTAISGNTIVGGAAGILVFVPALITSNHISNVSETGIRGVSGATVKNNTITQTSTGIEFQCSTGTVSGNIINGATIGIDMVPAAFTGVNTFYNVGTIRTRGAC
jgi:hypothetical protein